MFLKKPPFQHPVTLHNFKMEGEDTAERKRSVALDQTLFIHRHYLEEKRSWTAFNRSKCPNNSSQTLVGHIILAPAPAHETLNTVVKRCMAVSKHFNQKHTVITGDQALYCKLQELK